MLSAALSARLFTYSRFPRLRCSPLSRKICSSSPRQASEPPLPSPEELYSRLSHTTLAKKLQSSPEAMRAIRDFMIVLQNQGLDISSGKAPSTMQMMKLGMMKEVRDGMMKMTAEMQKAGIDPTDKARPSFV
ncbi:hypothetical protein DFJ43DRAFT_1156603 [Lentinula guzmanii]|uniref:Uncharacterized protein n=2 Tax=Lentinula TaxID=5352 RepID=A0AA38MY76_9AGAR|nr:hypothetical protein DFJ43DRAFT_1156603 [Lentinula guzmanii]KAJ3790548.1 hypothetical protein GGU10DRAFT_371173 [Lentinula aff. detonsa]